MAPNPRRQDEQLQALYDEIPEIECAGYCHDSCGPIQTTVRERVRMEESAGRVLTCGIGPSCSMLTPERTCSVYSIRPLICRLWGVTRSMQCPYGCKPARLLEDDEAMMMFVRADSIGGTPVGRARDLERQLSEQVKALGEQETCLRVRNIMRQTAVRPSIDGRHKLSRSIFEP